MDFCLAKKGNYESLDNSKYIYEPKYDGSRYCLISNGNKLKLINRRGLEKLDKYPEIEKLEFGNKSFVIDGEIIWGEYGNFNKLLLREHLDNKFKIELMSEQKPIKFVVFDLLEYDGKDLKEYPFKKRRELLEKYFNKYVNSVFKITKQYRDKATITELVKKKDLEGFMAKLKDSKYSCERTNSWQKIKNWSERIIEFVDYEDNEKGITLKTEDNRIRVLCAGNKSKEVKGILNKKGEIRCEIQYLTETENQKLRFPSFKRVIN